MQQNADNAAQHSNIVRVLCHGANYAIVW